MDDVSFNFQKELPTTRYTLDSSVLEIISHFVQGRITFLEFPVLIVAMNMLKDGLGDDKEPFCSQLELCHWLLTFNWTSFERLGKFCRYRIKKALAVMIRSHKWLK